MEKKLEKHLAVNKNFPDDINVDENGRWKFRDMFKKCYKEGVCEETGYLKPLKCLRFNTICNSYNCKKGFDNGTV